MTVNFRHLARRTADRGSSVPNDSSADRPFAQLVVRVADTHRGYDGFAATKIRSKSGANASGLANSIVLAPAVSASDTVVVPSVLKLPVGVNEIVSAGPPFALTIAWRPVVDPSRYAIVTT